MALSRNDHRIVEEVMCIRSYIVSTVRRSDAESCGVECTSISPVLWVKLDGAR
jgi:hypothetical protein